MNNKTISPLVIILMLVFIVVIPLLPVLISQRWDWWEAWVYAAVNIFAFAISRALATRRHPDILGERARFMQQSDTTKFDKILAPLIGLSDGFIPLIAGLDGRFNWSHAFSLALKIVSLMIILAGFSLASWAMIENRFFSGNVRIQSERGHVLVNKGPYRWIRHPGYAGSFFANLAIPILLDSSWAFIPVVFATIILILRTGLEDKYLQENLNGYAEYARQVRFRLLPGVW